MSQLDRVLSHLKENKTISPLQAWRDLGIYRLSAVIFKLRQEGHKIETNLVEVVNRWGESAFIAEYSLKVKDAS